MFFVFMFYIKVGFLRWFYLIDFSILKRFFILIIIRIWKLVDGFVLDIEKFSNILVNYLNLGICV